MRKEKGVIYCDAGDTTQLAVNKDQVFGQSW